MYLDIPGLHALEGNRSLGSEIDEIGQSRQLIRLEPVEENAQNAI